MQQLIKAWIQRILSFIIKLEAELAERFFYIKKLIYLKIEKVIKGQIWQLSSKVKQNKFVRNSNLIASSKKFK